MHGRRRILTQRRDNRNHEVHYDHREPQIQGGLRASVMSNIDDIERQEQRQTLIRLENEHSALDTQVTAISAVPGVDQMTLSRLKRRKLLLKDAIVKLRSNVLPDQPA